MNEPTPLSLTVDVAIACIIAEDAENIDIDVAVACAENADDIPAVLAGTGDAWCPVWALIAWTPDQPPTFSPPKRPPKTPPWMSPARPPSSTYRSRLCGTGL
jgi:hypothetical protein